MVKPERIQRVVREVIQESELPRALLARDAELSRAALEAWMSGVRTPQSESVEQLANGLMRRVNHLQQLAVRLLALREQMDEPK
jgi:transcriptional regulator with XRE-family HTH domain